MVRVDGTLGHGEAVGELLVDGITGEVNPHLTVGRPVVVVTDEGPLDQLLGLGGGQQLAREGEVGVTDGDLQTVV